MLSPAHLRTYVVRPTLEALGMWSVPAEELVMGTAAQESGLRWLHQLGDGPALGLWQMEPATHDDILDNYLKYRPALSALVRDVAGVVRLESQHLIGHLVYGCAFARLHYRRVPEPLPDDVHGWAGYWKRHYNTMAGRGTAQEWIESYQAMHREER